MPDEQDLALNINVTTAENITAIDVSAKINFKMSNLLKFFNETQPMTTTETQPITTTETQPITTTETQPIEIIPIEKTYKNALLIGCNYINSEYELRGCINDATNINQILTESYGFDNIVLLTDETEKKPNKEIILEELKQLLINASSGDILFLSFSGHGINLVDRNGDEKDGLDEVIVTLDIEYITDDELNSLIQRHLKKNVTLFALFDCCHSGTILDLRYQYLDSTRVNKDTENLKNLETEGNVIMISGCMDRQTSMDAYIRTAGTYQGAMTWAFLETINKHPELAWIDLLNRMRYYLKNADYEQIPQLSSGKELDLMLNFLSA